MTMEILFIFLPFSSEVMRRTSPNASDLKLKTSLFLILILSLEFGALNGCLVRIYGQASPECVYSEQFKPTEHTYNCSLLPHRQVNNLN